MYEKISPNNIKNDDYSMNNKENDYKNLITRLKEINVTIALLEKKYLDKI